MGEHLLVRRAHRGRALLVERQEGLARAEAERAAAAARRTRAAGSGSDRPARRRCRPPGPPRGPGPPARPWWTIGGPRDVARRARAAAPGRETPRPRDRRARA